MSLTRFHSQSHQIIHTNKVTIENAPRVTCNQTLCLYCDQQATGTETHILLQCPGIKHIANDLIATLSKFLELSHQPTWNSCTHCTNKLPSCLQTHPQHSPKNFITHGSTLLSSTFPPSHQPSDSRHTCTTCPAPCNPISLVPTLSPLTRETDKDKRTFSFFLFSSSVSRNRTLSCLKEAEIRQQWVVNGHDTHTPDSRKACQAIAFFNNFTPEKSRPIKIEPLSIA